MAQKDKNWRYLGPASWSQRLLRLLPFSKLFNEPAKGHDTGYFKGGDKEDKSLTDSQFLIGMFKKCRFNPFAYICACIYFLLVAFLGFIFFNYKETVSLKFIPKSQKCGNYNSKH